MNRLFSVLFFLLIPVANAAAPQAQLEWDPSFEEHSEVRESRSTEPKLVSGVVYLWERELCELDIKCLPRPLGIQFDIEALLTEPTQRGTATRKVVTAASGSWSLRAVFIWKNTEDAERSYIVSQFELRRRDFGLVALCSSYDWPEGVDPFVTGACGGQFEGKLVGLTYKKSE